MKRMIALFLSACLLCGLCCFGEEGTDITGYWKLVSAEGEGEDVQNTLDTISLLDSYGGSMGFEFNKDGSVSMLYILSGQRNVYNSALYRVEGEKVTLYNDGGESVADIAISENTLTVTENGVTLIFEKTEGPRHAEPMEIGPEDRPIATITMENGDKIVLELYPDKAPNTVANFIALANSGFYDGLIFHRVISGFMIQGGDPKGNGTGGPGYTILGEFAQNGFDTNDINHERGVISMARAQAFDSAGSQFFIMHADAPHLDGGYAAFGRVLSGMETVDAIAATATNASNKPLADQVIRSIRVDTKGIEYTVIKAGE